jgi:hypothetical protein
MHLDAKQLHNYLMKHYSKVQPLVRDDIYKTVRTQQMRRANAGRREAQAVKWWADLMTEAQREKRSVRASLAHDTDNAERQEVFIAYYAAVKRSLDIMKAYKRRGMTPNKAQDERKEMGKPPYPNDLTHWSDLIPTHIKEAITEAFNAMPYKPKAKRKVPFTRD